MKKIITLISVAAIIMSALGNPSFAQTSKQAEKTIRQQKKELYKNPQGIVKKEARKLSKEGWKAMELSLEKMIQNTWEKEILYDEDGYPKYIYVTTQATASNYSAAQMEAQNVAKIRIASLLSSTVASLADVALQNQEIDPRQAESMSNVAEKAKVLVSGKLGRLMVPLNIYKEGPEGYTVRNTVMYDMKQATKLMYDAINSNLPEADKDKLGKVIEINSMIDQYEKNNVEE
ncbi:MAG: hypothetical protein MJY89_08020 [Bacteroidales bacterium]|nr:hypothetical protein [Bacteroidales bacterium]